MAANDHSDATVCKQKVTLLVPSRTAKALHYYREQKAKIMRTEPLEQMRRNRSSATTSWWRTIHATGPTDAFSDPLFDSLEPVARSF